MPHHVVVDGSNLATEGRSNPSLKQLNEAVTAYMAEHPTALVTVVVDATFGHRIDPREVAEFDAAVANNEIVAPPAGAIGRGDAFVLSIAHKVNATVLSNDSYQEFHGQYPWLFDEGRLVGGKPVPHVGWVFVERLPVRGPTSRKAVAASKRRAGRGAEPAPTVITGSPEASQPMPVPKTPPPGLRAPKATAPSTVPQKAQAKEPATKQAATAPPSGDAANDVVSFLTFVEHHPPGTSVNAVVDSYSSHGAYVTIGEPGNGGVRGYVPLRLMSDPPPRSAREVMRLGESLTLVVEALHAARRSIDLAMPTMATVKFVEKKPATRRTAKKAPADQPPATEPPAEQTVVAKAPAKKAAAKKAPAKKPAAKKAPAKEPATKKAPAKEPATKKAPAKETAANTAPAKEPATKKAAAGSARRSRAATPE